MPLATFWTRSFEGEKLVKFLVKNFVENKLVETQENPIPGDTGVLLGCARQSRKG